MAVLSRACKLVTLGLFTSEERFRSLIFESAHDISSITSHSQTITIASNKVHFIINCSREKAAIYRSATKNKINIWKLRKSVQTDSLIRTA